MCLLYNEFSSDFCGLNLGPRTSLYFEGKLKPATKKNPSRSIRKLVKDMKKHFNKEDMQMPNKQWKDIQHHQSFVKCKLKQQWYSSHLSEMTKKKISDDAKCWWGEAITCVIGANVNGIATLEEFVFSELPNQPTMGS